MYCALSKVSLSRALNVFFRSRASAYFASTSSVDAREVNHFKKFVDNWWDPHGPLKTLHSMNKLRVPLIREGLVQSQCFSKTQINSPKPLIGLNILDVGCGGGILSEPLAKLGANVTGLDANAELIEQAKLHSINSKLDLNYLSTTVEEHEEENKEKYEAIVASEIIEHVNNQANFVKSCTDCLKPGGSIFFTTINKTTLSNIAAIFIAEDVLNLVPKGSHTFEKFLQPHDLQRLLEMNRCKTFLVHGMFYLPINNRWYWTSNTQLNYALHAVKS